MRDNVRAGLTTQKSFDDFCAQNGFVHRSVHDTDGFESRRELQLAIAKCGAKEGQDVVYRSERSKQKKYRMTVAFKDQAKAAMFKLHQ